MQKFQRRGAEIFATELASELGARGHETAVIGLYRSDVHSMTRENGIDCCLDADADARSERLLGINPLLLRKFKAVIDKFAPDVVQVNGARTIKYGAAVRAIRAGTWTLVYRNIDSPLYWNRRFLRRQAYRSLVMPLVDAVVGVSRTTLAEARAVYALRVPCRAIPRAVDSGFLEAAPSREDSRLVLQIGHDTPTLLFIGHLSTQKRPDRFLEVVRAVAAREPRVCALIVGDGPMRDELAEHAKRLGLGESVRLVGRQEDVRPYIAACDVLVLTSDSEGIPGVILEAGFIGRPVVCADVGGVFEAVQDGLTGVLVEPGHIEAYAGEIVGLLSSPDRRLRMGANARAWVKSRFTMRQVADAYEAFYSDVHATRRNGRTR